MARWLLCCAITHRMFMPQSVVACQQLASRCGQCAPCLSSAFSVDCARLLTLLCPLPCRETAATAAACVRSVRALIWTCFACTLWPLAIGFTTHSLHRNLHACTVPIYTLDGHLVVPYEYACVWDRRPRVTGVTVFTGATCVRHSTACQARAPAKVGGVQGVCNLTRARGRFFREQIGKSADNREDTSRSTGPPASPGPRPSPRRWCGTGVRPTAPEAACGA